MSQEDSLKLPQKEYNKGKHTDFPLLYWEISLLRKWHISILSCLDRVLFWCRQSWKEISKWSLPWTELRTKLEAMGSWRAWCTQRLSCHHIHVNVTTLSKNLKIVCQHKRPDPGTSHLSNTASAACSSRGWASLSPSHDTYLWCQKWCKNVFHWSSLTLHPILQLV